MRHRTGVAQKSDVSTGTSAKTLIQLLAVQAIELAEVCVGFHGVDNTAEPILVELVRQTDAGTMSSLTPAKNDDSVGDSLATTAQHTATVEPTTTDVLRLFTVHPQTSLVVMFPEDTRPVVGSGDRVGLRVTAAADVKADAYLAFNE